MDRPPQTNSWYNKVASGPEAMIESKLSAESQKGCDSDSTGVLVP